MTENPRTPQFQAAQPHLHAVYDIARNLPIVREQAQRCVALFLLIEYLQRLAPGCLLLVIDLAQIQRALRCTILPPGTRRFSTMLK